MTLLPHGYDYPVLSISAESFPTDAVALITKPPGLIEDVWPPNQVVRLFDSLVSLGCKTILVEDHYIDRDYIQDLSLFYSRSLRSYPNYCQRLHFFSNEFDQSEWRKMVTNVKKQEKHVTSLQKSYLGFAVIRPLPGCPIGRTVLSTLDPITASGYERRFDALRSYAVHIGAFTLTIKGLAFQQQDQGVSACATIALWSAMHKVTEMEGLAPPSPAEITEAASRYLLAEGRSLPSGGLNVQQISEAVRAAGLQPLVVPSTSFDDNRAQLLGYLSSGFPVLLAIKSVQSGMGHAVCAVGLKMGDIAPQADPDLRFRDAATAVRGVYIHDDRLGPYTLAALGSWTLKDGAIGTGVLIETEQSILQAMIVPLPAKIRMPISRIRALGLALAQLCGTEFKEIHGHVSFTNRYIPAIGYRENAIEFGLTPDGIYDLTCATVLSRYIGLLEVVADENKLFDVLLDATETLANPSILAFVRRNGFPRKYKMQLEIVATQCGARLIW